MNIIFRCGLRWGSIKSNLDVFGGGKQSNHKIALGVFRDK